MSRNVRSIAFALLLVFVSASAAQALPLGEAPESGLVSRMLSWIGTLLSPELTPVWEMEGSSMDPNGEPKNNSWSVPNTDEGSSMDPNG
ncbi:MAG: hypothetical protein QOH06_2021 [Acidobacteriota bacterium]|nr:hypothetical protein [Acidobacteriota bacterium]